jgi:hypothetical protein
MNLRFEDDSLLRYGAVLVEVGRRFGSAYRLYYRLDDGGDKHS